MVRALRGSKWINTGLLVLSFSAFARTGLDSAPEDLNRSAGSDSGYSETGAAGLPVKNNLQLPMGFQHRLRPAGQSRLQWHFHKEAASALAIGGIYTGAIAARRLLPEYINPVLLNCAGVTLDYLTSQDITDFGFRLGLRSIPFLASLIWSRSPCYVLNPMLEALILEIPDAIRGVSEYSRQSSRHTSGVIDLLPGSEFDQKFFGIFFYAENEPGINIQFRDTSANKVCQEGHPVDDETINPELMKLHNAAREHQISQMELSPFSYQGHQLVATFSKKNGAEFKIIIKYPHANTRLSWLTEPLRFNSAVKGLKPALSPLSQCVLSELTGFLNSVICQETSETLEFESECSDLEVPILSTDNLVLFPLGKRGYFLADHGNSQGLCRPDIWLNSVAKTELITQEWLNNLEYHLIPGPEKGVWRLASILRSVVTRTSARYGISWLMGVRDVEQPGRAAGRSRVRGNERAAPRAAPRAVPGPEVRPAQADLSLTLDDIRNRLATPEGLAQYQASIPRERNVVLVWGGSRNDNNRFIRHIMRSEENHAAFANRYRHGLIRVFDHPEHNNLYVELPDDLRNLQARSANENLINTARMWINRTAALVGIYDQTSFVESLETIRANFDLFRTAPGPGPNLIGLVQNAPDYLDEVIEQLAFGNTFREVRLHRANLAEDLSDVLPWAH